MSLPRVLTSARACELGFSRTAVATELRRGRWQRLTRNVYLSRPDEPTRTDWIATGLALEPGAVLSGWDAARTHLLGASRPPTEQVLMLLNVGHCRDVGQLHLRQSSRLLRLTHREVDGFGRLVVASAAWAVADNRTAHRPLINSRERSVSVRSRLLITDRGGQLSNL